MQFTDCDTLRTTWPLCCTNFTPVFYNWSCWSSTKEKKAIVQLSQKLSTMNTKSHDNSILHRQVHDVSGVKMQLIFQGSKEYC